MNILANTTTGVAAPPVPKTLEDMQLPMVMMRDIVLKTMFRKSIERVSALATAICLPRAITQELIDLIRGQKLIEATGSLHAGGATSEMGYRLTDMGRARALDALAQSEYFGPMPVPLNVYQEQVKRQSITNIQITRDRLTKAMQHLVLPSDFLGTLGPAISSGRSILMYGPPGNGKSSISNGIRDALGDRIYVPRALEYSGQVITVYDPVVHTAAVEERDNPNALRVRRSFDARFVRCERPTVITGGELSLDMLDLVYDSTARTYQAPLQLKSTGGVFIVDDLGRQAEPPQALINRWIVPLEERKDILALQSGEKFEVPFDTLVVFSTNFHPNKIFDRAALRRIFFKIKIDGPTKEEFLKVFSIVARAKGMRLDERTLVYLLKEKYPTIGNEFAMYQPVFLIDQMIAICEFEDIPRQMSPELIERAWANMFVDDEEICS